MNDTMRALMREATRLTGQGRLSEATAAIQRALGGTAEAPARQDDVIDGCVSEPGAAVPGAFTAGRFGDGRLSRDYKLYLPAGVAGTNAPLVVMLHGCTQDPDDFAAGTGMNRLADAHGLAVLYPAQAQEANPQRCWNWFKHHHQQRGRGEAALIAALTQDVVKRHGLDPARVYVAGLSAGGAMAGVLAASYPEVYAAVGVHSGLAPGVAGSLPQALAAMRGEPGAAARPLHVPAIVFHGDADHTVHPRNGEAAVAAALVGRDGTVRVEPGRSAGGRRYTRTVHLGADGVPVAEHWLLHGGGHAWSGGSAAGSFTDASGPDASAEMLRFFADQATTRSARSAAIAASP